MTSSNSFNVPLAEYKALSEKMLDKAKNGLWGEVYELEELRQKIFSENIIGYDLSGVENSEELLSELLNINSQLFEMADGIREDMISELKQTAVAGKAISFYQSNQIG